MSTRCPEVVFSEGNVSSSVSGKDVYLVVRHRNHLDVMSSVALTDSNGALTYDFTSNVSAAIGGTAGIKENAKGGRIAMFSGDAIYDSNLGVSDYSSGVIPTIGADGYLKSDVNYDRNVGVSDFSTSILGNIGQTSQVP